MVVSNKVTRTPALGRERSQTFVAWLRNSSHSLVSAHPVRLGTTLVLALVTRGECCVLRAAGRLIDAWCSC